MKPTWIKPGQFYFERRGNAFIIFQYIQEADGTLRDVRASGEQRYLSFEKARERVYALNGWNNTNSIRQ